MIAILDAHAGNIRSVFNAVYGLGYDVDVVSHLNNGDDYTHLIIPGVGSFYSVMSAVNSSSLRSEIVEFSESGRPTLGICLGMQMFADWGSEGGGSEGLGLIHGKVDSMDCADGLLMPHVGWNTVSFNMRHPCFEGIKDNVDCYFVHSYHFRCVDYKNVYASTDYGAEFSSVVGKGNVVGVQFHPEKSQSNGIKMIDNFCSWDGEC